jgi:hypothetical protein
MPTELRLHGNDGSNYELSLNIIRFKRAGGSKWEHGRAEGSGGGAEETRREERGAQGKKRIVLRRAKRDAERI